MRFTVVLLVVVAVVAVVGACATPVRDVVQASAEVTTRAELLAREQEPDRIIINRIKIR